MKAEVKYKREVFLTAQRILKKFYGSKEYALRIIDATIEGLKADNEISPVDPQTFQFWNDVRAQINK